MVTKLRASYALFVRFPVIAPDMCSFPIQWCKIYDLFNEQHIASPIHYAAQPTSSSPTGTKDDLLL